MGLPAYLWPLISAQRQYLHLHAYSAYARTMRHSAYVDEEGMCSCRAHPVFTLIVQTAQPFVEASPLRRPFAATVSCRRPRLHLVQL